VAIDRPDLVSSLVLVSPAIHTEGFPALVRSMFRTRLGKQLVQFFLEKAKGLGIKRVFVLTRMPAFFEKCGFRTVSINSLPQKVTKDCAKCPKNHACDEIAMVQDLNMENGS
jgi:N-acetylglutamate synthase-like GNAT family acetyltransferase